MWHSFVCAFACVVPSVDRSIPMSLLSATSVLGLWGRRRDAGADFVSRGTIIWYLSGLVRNETKN